MGRVGRRGEERKEGEDWRGGVRTGRREERRRMEWSGAGEHGVRASHNVTGGKKFE